MSRHEGRFPFPRLMAMILLALLALPARSVQARQEPATGFMAVDEEMVQKLLRFRTRDELVAELESARKRKAAAEGDLAEMEGLGSGVVSRVAVKRQEIELLKQRVRLAKKEANASQATQLESQRQREEQQLGVLEAMREAADSQIDRARAARDFAKARIDLQELELDLVDKREARVARAAEPARPQDPRRDEVLAALDRQIGESSRKVLGSIRDEARRSERLAKATEGLAKANLRLRELWEEYSSR